MGVVGFPTLVITHGAAFVSGNDPHPAGCGGSGALWGFPAGSLWETVWLAELFAG